jgi:ParB-like chromosome segregation protein Spo0J
MLVKNTIVKHPARDLKVRANVRKCFSSDEELMALARSYIARPIHPLIILPDKSLADGERRWRGLMMIDPDHPVGCLTVDKELSPSELTELQLLSALHSETLNPFDQAVAIKEWTAQNAGATSKSLADKIELSGGWLTKLSSLWGCIPPVVEAASQGKIGPKAWYPISLLKEPADQQGLLSMHLSGMPGEQIASLSRAKRKAPAAEGETKTASRTKCIVPGKDATLQISAGSSMTLDQMIEVAKEWVKRATRASENGWNAKTLESACKNEAAKPKARVAKDGAA